MKLDSTIPSPTKGNSKALQVKPQPRKAKVNRFKDNLTVKQSRFVTEYIKDGNGSRAAKEAGYNAKPEVLPVIASENLNKPNIREAIEEALSGNGVTPDYIIKGFKVIAETSDNDMVAVRSLENLADISEMYPKTGTKMDIEDGKLSISWLD